MLLLEAGGIVVDRGDRRVLDIDNIKIYDGEKIGLIGENGAGKTTLLEVLCGALRPDEGRVRAKGEIAYIRQMGAEEESSDGYLRSRFASGEGMSGGEKTRRRIAAALARRAPILLADEPTTDLDQEGIEELRQDLAGYDGALLLVSHDRNLLDSLCTRIWHLEDGHITDFPGTYTEYRAELESKRAYQAEEYEKYRGEQARLRASIQDVNERNSQAKSMKERYKTNGEARLHKMDGRQASEKTHQAKKQLESRLAHMEVKERPREDVKITMALGLSHPVGAKTALEVRGLSLSAGDKELLRDASMELPTGSRTALVGPNGCGKTTLIRLIASERSDCVRVNPAVRFGWFDQTHEGTLDPEKTILENILRETSHPESDVRTVLARLAFRREAVFKPVRVLSGGERGRVAIAKLLLSDANTLLLDEPTNHLDIFTLEALQELLKGYRGTILFVSHDSAFREAVATRTVEIRDRKLAVPEVRYERRSADEERDLVLMRMAAVAARMSQPEKGDDPEKLNEEYERLVEKLRVL